jgi:hypothetical protein
MQINNNFTEELNMKNNMNETDVRVNNEIFKMYMTDDQYDRVSETEKNEGRELTDDEYYALKCKLY